jgi:Glycosyl transferase family 2/Sulfotransferase family
MSLPSDTIASPRSPVLVVAGMHRSGTSCVAELLASAGLFLGDELLEADPTNLRGYFEDHAFVDYHRRLLSAHGLADDGFVGDVRIEPSDAFREQAMKLVEAKRRLLQPWGWKDPRSVLLLDFWADLVPDARYFFVFRPPWDVVDSLYRRGDRVFSLNPRFALTMWMHYNARIRDFARSHPDRVLVRELSQVIRDPEAICDAVRNELNITLDPPKPTVHPELLRHSDADHAAFLAAASPECMSLLDELRSLAGMETEPTPAPLRRSDDPSLEQGLIAWQRNRARERLSRPPVRDLAARTGQRVFIAVPVYKGQDFVQETLRSIQRQEHADFKVCISVDGDDQVSAEACEPFLRDPRFAMHVQPRQLGWAGNLNWLIDRCDGDFFCFWQQDDLAATSYLSRLVAHAAREPDAACVFSDVQWFGSRIDRVETPSLTGFALERVLQQIERGYYAPFFGLVPAVVLERVGPVRLTPHDSPLEDQVWLATLVAQGPWHRVPGTLYFKRGHTAETHLKWEGSTNDAFRRLTWLEWGAGMLQAAMSASPPQEHGKVFDIVFDRLTTARESRWLFYDPRAGGAEAFEIFRDDFTNLARRRFQVVGAVDRWLGHYAVEAGRRGALSLAIGAGEPALALLGSGWSQPEANGVWSDGSTAVLRLPETANGPWKIVLTASPFPGSATDRMLTVRIGDRIVAQHVYAAGAAHTGQPLEFTVDKPGRLTLEMPWATSPRDLGRSGDSRRLGICLHRVEIEKIARVSGSSGD